MFLAMLDVRIWSENKNCQQQNYFSRRINPWLQSVENSHISAKYCRASNIDYPASE
jgi:hypothetical protein